MGVRSRRLSTPSSAIGSQRSIRRRSFMSRSQRVSGRPRKSHRSVGSRRTNVTEAICHESTASPNCLAYHAGSRLIEVHHPRMIDLRLSSRQRQAFESSTCGLGALAIQNASTTSRRLDLGPIQLTPYRDEAELSRLERLTQFAPTLQHAADHRAAHSSSGSPNAPDRSSAAGAKALRCQADPVWALPRTNPQKPHSRVGSKSSEWFRQSFDDGTHHGINETAPPPLGNHC